MHDKKDPIPIHMVIVRTVYRSFVNTTAVLFSSPTLARAIRTCIEDVERATDPMEGEYLIDGYGYTIDTDQLRRLLGGEIETIGELNCEAWPEEIQVVDVVSHPKKD